MFGIQVAACGGFPVTIKSEELFVASLEHGFWPILNDMSKTLGDNFQFGTESTAKGQL